jgi:hypothetical protein
MTAKSKDFITVVSGLPRSGTSMMMRMLEVGGMHILTDNIRQADADNPNGYYEFEPVKQLSRDASWLMDAPGKAVKMVYPLLYDLPQDYEYKVIFMNRHPGEVVASQDAMLQRQGKNTGALSTANFAELLQKELQRLQAWLQPRSNFAVLNLNYNCIVTDPHAAVNEIDRFLGYPLDTQAMIGVFDVSLYRQRRS